MYRGSQKHVLDWVEQPRFLPELLQMVRPVDVKVTAESRWMPLGYRDPDEARLDTFGPFALPGMPVWSELQSWWLRHLRRANTPNWDLALSCEIEGRPGLILVEAKANESELSDGGKTEEKTPSVNSQENQARIVAALEEASAGYKRAGMQVALNVKSYYQLANRLAFTWKLAMSGVPVVLVYIGFTGDTGIEDVSTPFRDAGHWREHFADHLRRISPNDLTERRLDFGQAAAWMLVRSRAVIEVSKRRPEVATA
jgi:hypothetical protein